MRNILKGIKLRFEVFVFMIRLLPIFIWELKKHKYGNLNLQQKMSEEHYHKMNTWTHWRR